MKKINLIALLILIFSLNAVAQISFPRESQRQEIIQTVGDTKIAVVYHRPNVKDRKVWDGLEKYGAVWRTGANENTTFETSNDIKINGQTLPKGKYGLHTIPNKDEWTIIFNKVNSEWGSFNYDQKQDALRVMVKPMTANLQETMAINFENVKANTSDVVIAWERVKVPFTIDVGDINGRVLTDIRTQMGSVKADDFRTPAQAAGWVLNSKMTANYEEALKWVDASIKTRETFGNLNIKARLLGGLNRQAEAIATAEKAIQVGKAATPAANTTDLEKMVAEWKTSK
ncbi:MAG: DUF2911 domain-containing protein [Pyrinomonadaceae bacterium]|nr:DUF2911 domain-containing protein [Pyrinomonadaceae bacterium]